MSHDFTVLEHPSLYIFRYKKLVFVAALAAEMIEDDLAHTHTLRSYLHELVAIDILETLLKTHHHLRYHTRLLVRATGANVGELLCLRNVDYEVVVSRVSPRD